VQIPVLPLPALAAEWTHGLYCDEFAEHQTKDIPVRQFLGGFLPANRVGTGFAREALERLAADRVGQPFDPSSLTEDYETGFEIYRMGYRQILVSLSSELVATRASHAKPRPRSAKDAAGFTGIALQGWQRHDWNMPWRQVYWFWRDAKAWSATS
jgi:adsorption protein B